MISMLKNLYKEITIRMKSSSDQDDILDNILLSVKNVYDFTMVVIISSNNDIKNYIRTYPSIDIEHKYVSTVKSLILSNLESIHVIHINEMYYHIFNMGKDVKIVGIKQESLNKETLDELYQFMLFNHQLNEYMINNSQVVERLHEIIEERNTLRDIIDGIPLQIMFKDKEMKYSILNNEAKKYLSKQGIKLEGKTADEAYPKNIAKRINNADQLSLESKNYIVTIEEGDTESYAYRRTPVYDKFNHLLGIVVAGENITKAKKIQEELKRINNIKTLLMQISLNVFSASVESEINDRINYTLKLTGSFLKAARAFAFSYDYEAYLVHCTHEWCKEGVSSSIKDFQNIPMEIFYEDYIVHHEKGENIHIRNIQDINHDKPLYHLLNDQGLFNVLTYPLMINNHCVGFIGFDDVMDAHIWNDTEQSLFKILAQIISNLLSLHNKEKELIEAKNSADLANRHKSEFIASISHEIRTPLSGIHNALYLLRDSSLYEETKEYIDIAQVSLESLGLLLNNMLDLSKIESKKMELGFSSFDLEEEILKIIKIQYSLLYDKNIDLIFDYDYQINYQIVSDVMKLKQIIMNLFSNAIKYTKNGYVKIQVKEIQTSTKQSIIRISIEDTGIGITSEELDRLTDRFFRVQNSINRYTPGTGIGLSIVKELLELFGSQLKIDTQLNKGSMFYFDLEVGKDENIEFFKHGERKKCAIIGDLHNEQNCIKMISSLNLDITGYEINDFLDLHKQEIMLYDYLIVLNHLDLFKLDKFTIQLEKREHHKPLLITCNKNTRFIDYSVYENHGIDLYFDIISSRADMYRQLVEKENNHMHKSHEIKKYFFREQPLRILLVEDTKINQRAMKIIISKLGFDVTTANDGNEAVEQSNSMKFDLILMDISLPKLNGIEATKIIRNYVGYNQETPIVALTAHAYKKDFDEFYKSGMNDVINKPVDTQSLLLIFDKYLKAEILDYIENDELLIPKNLKIFNLKAFLYRIEGLEDLAKELVGIFKASYMDDLHGIEEAIFKLDQQMIYRRLHNFLGNCDYIGAERTVWLIRKMINHIEENLEKKILNISFIKLKNEINTLLYELNKFLN